MAQQVIFADGSELILLLKGKAQREPYNLTPDKIQRIAFSNYTNRLLGIIPQSARRITVVCKGLGPVEFDEPKHKQFFEEYLTILRKYCADNRVTFYDFDHKA